MVRSESMSSGLVQRDSKSQSKRGSLTSVGSSRVSPGHDGKVTTASSSKGFLFTFFNNLKTCLRVEFKHPQCISNSFIDQKNHIIFASLSFKKQASLFFTFSDRSNVYRLSAGSKSSQQKDLSEISVTWWNESDIKWHFVTLTSHISVSALNQNLTL